MRRLTTVTVVFESTLRFDAGRPGIDVCVPDGSTLKDVLECVNAELGDGALGKSARYWWRHGTDLLLATLNGRAVNVKDFETTQVREGDVVRLFPPIGGG